MGPTNPNTMTDRVPVWKGNFEYKSDNPMVNGDGDGDVVVVVVVVVVGEIVVVETALSCK